MGVVVEVVAPVEPLFPDMKHWLRFIVAPTVPSTPRPVLFVMFTLVSVTVPVVVAFTPMFVLAVIVAELEMVAFPEATWTPSSRLLVIVPPEIVSVPEDAKLTPSEAAPPPVIVHVVSVVFPVPVTATTIP